MKLPPLIFVFHTIGVAGVIACAVASLSVGFYSGFMRSFASPLPIFWLICVGSSLQLLAEGKRKRAYVGLFVALAIGLIGACVPTIQA